VCGDGRDPAGVMSIANVFMAFARGEVRLDEHGAAVATQGSSRSSSSSSSSSGAGAAAAPPTRPLMFASVSSFLSSFVHPRLLEGVDTENQRRRDKYYKPPVRVP